MLAILVPMVFFTLVVALLSATVLVVRRRLTVRENVTLTINGQQVLPVVSGDSLLATLVAAGIHLPAACGGRGTCGQCRVIVNHGNGRLLPTETSHINPRDALAGARLSCMLKVRESLELNLPAAILQAKQWRARVRSNCNVSTYLTELILELPAIEAARFQAGDYLLLEAPAGMVSFASFEIDAGYQAEWERRNLQRYTVAIQEPTTRAYSLANPPAEKGIVILVVRIALPPVNAPPDTPPGKVSSYIFSLKPGNMVNVSGPFGEFHARESDREMVFIGGGAGIAPLRSIIHDQLLNRATQRKISFWYGSRNLRELVYVDEFETLAAQYDNFVYQVALSEPDPDDEWEGPTGFIHRVVYEHYLKDHFCPEEVEYYLCGPPMMSSAVLAMLEDLGVDRESVLFDDFGSHVPGEQP